MKVQVLLIALFSFIISTAQNKLAMLYSSTGMEYGKANCVDANNNYINGALFQNTINVNPNGTTNLTSSGLATEIALTKYTPDGNLLWAKRIGSGNTSEAPHGLETDAAGNIYMTGYFGSTTVNGPLACSFDPNGGNSISSQGNEDCFLAKYDANGNYIWSIALGNQGQNTQERAWDIAVDASGNSYITGGFWGSVNFNPLGTSMVYSVTSNSGLFFAKYNTNGICQWVIVLDAQNTNVFTEGYGTLDVDNSGNLYVAGNYRNSSLNMNSNGTAFNLSNAGNCDIFIAKYNTSNGLLQWAKSIGSPAQDIVSPGALRLDKNDNPYFTGRLSGTNTVDFDPGTGVANISSSSLFLAALNTDGSFRMAIGFTSGTGDGGHRVVFDSQNNAIVSGWMNGTANFGNGITATAFSTTADVFFAKFTNAGVCQWAFNFGGSGSTDNSICAGLSVDQQDNIYITGQLYGSNSDVDPTADVLNF